MQTSVYENTFIRGALASRMLNIVLTCTCPDKGNKVYAGAIPKMHSINSYGLYMNIHVSEDCYSIWRAGNTTRNLDLSANDPRTGDLEIPSAAHWIQSKCGGLVVLPFRIVAQDQTSLLS